MISNTSGASGIAIWINAHLKLTGEAAIDKKDPLVTELKAWVDQQYAEGRVTAITDDELKAQLRIAAEKLAGGGNGNEE